MSNLRTTVPKAYVPGLRKLIVEGIMNMPDYVPIVANIDTTNQSREIYQDYADPQPWEDVGENGQTPFGTSINGYTTTFTPKTYKGGMEYSKESMDDALYSNSPSKRRTQAIGAGYIEKRNKDFFSIFNNAFDTTYTSYGDAKPMLSTVHPIPSGAFTQSNASATGEVLSHDALESMMLRMQQLKKFNGEPEARSGNRFLLMAPPALRKSAIEITDSERVSGEFSNTVNVHFGGKRVNVETKMPAGDYFMANKYNLSLLINPWIANFAGGSDTAWFLIETGNHGITFLNRTGLELSEDTDSVGTHALKIAGFARFDYGWYAWKGVDGSKGDGAAYAS